MEQHDAAASAGYDEMRAELDAIRRQQRELAKRAGWLMKRVEAVPAVTPVLVYLQYGGTVREDHEHFTFEGPDLVRRAYEYLDQLEEQGLCSAVGVEVGGALIDSKTLRERYGRGQ